MAGFVTDPTLIDELSSVAPAGQDGIIEHNGKRYRRVIEGAPQKEPAAASDSDWKTYIQGLVRAAAQGATFNWADEIEALATSFGGGDYEKTLARVRDEMDRFAKANPKTALAAELAGGFAVPGGAMVSGARAAGRGASLASRMVRGSAIGGVGGGLSVVGSAENMADKSLTENATDIGMGVGLGAAGGAVIPAALEGAKRGVRAIATSLPDDSFLGRMMRRTKENVALEEVNDALRKDAMYDGVTHRQRVDQIRNAIDESRHGPQGTGGASILGASANEHNAITGENVRALARDAASRSPEAQGILRGAERRATDRLPSNIYDDFYLRGDMRPQDARAFMQLARSNPAVAAAAREALNELQTGNVRNIRFNAELMHNVDMKLSKAVKDAEAGTHGTSARNLQRARDSVQNLIDRSFPDQPGMPSLRNIQRPDAIARSEIDNLAQSRTRADANFQSGPGDAAHNAAQAGISASLGRGHYAAQKTYRALSRLMQGDLDKGVMVTRILTELSGRQGIDPSHQLNRWINRLEQMTEPQRNRWVDGLIQNYSQQVGANYRHD